MDERHDTLAEWFAEREGDDDDWLADEEPTAGPARLLEHPTRPATRRPRRLAPSLPGSRLLPFGAVTIALIAAVVLAVLQLRGTSGALADPSEAARAAKRAGSFAFASTSKLQLAGSPTVESKVEGKVVDLAHAGAFRVRVRSALGVGFERIVLPDAVFVRPITVHGAGVWLGAHLKPPAVISVHSASGGGLAIPLGLLAALAQSHAQYVQSQEVDHQPTRYYRLTLPLGKLLGASSHAPRSVARIPVEIGVWQNSEQQLVRAVRTFDIGGPRAERLTIQTDFTGYGKQTSIQAPPGVHLRHTERLAPTADDPLSASVLAALAAGTGHGPTPGSGPSRLPGAPGALAPGRGPTP